MTISVSAIRRLVAAEINKSLSVSGWQESTIPCDQFGSGESDSMAHKGYAVGCVGTTFSMGRQQPGIGALAESDIRVRWSYNLAALDQVAGYDEALDAAGVLVASSRRIMGVSSVVLVSSNHAVDDQGWMLGEVALRVLHLFDLM